MKRLQQVALVGLLILNGELALGQAKVGLHVVDANGQRIGYTNGEFVTTFIGGAPYLISVARNGFLTSDVMIFIDQADCSGPQYIRVAPSTSLIERAWFTTDGFFHYAPAASAVSNVVSGSTRILHGDGSFGPCVQGGGVSDSAAPHLSVSATFTPPFLVVETLPVSPAPAVATFDDVPTNHPFFRFVEALRATGLTAGCQASPPLYCPNAPMTRGQMAVFLATALGL